MSNSPASPTPATPPGPPPPGPSKAPEPTPGHPAGPPTARLGRLRGGFLRLYGGLPRTVYWLALGNFLNRLGMFAMPLLTRYLTKELGLDLSTAGLFILAYGLGALVSALLGGTLADTLGRRRTMLLSLVGAGALWLAVGFVENTQLLFGLLAASGLFAEMYRAAFTAAVGDVCPQALRARAFALCRTASNAGIAFGPLIAGLLVEFASFRWLFAGEAITCLAFALLVYLRIQETRPTQVPEGPRLEGGLRRILGDRPFLMFCAANIGLGCVFLQQISVLPIFTTDHLGLPDAAFLGCLALNGGLVVLGEMWLVRFTSKHDPLRLVGFGACLIGLGFGLLPHAEGLGGLLGCCALWTLGEMAALPAMSNWTSQRASPELRGRYMGLLGLGWGVAFTLGQPLATRAAEEIGFEALFHLSLGICLASAATIRGVAWLVRRGRPRGVSPFAGLPSDRRNAA